MTSAVTAVRAQLVIGILRRGDEILLVRERFQPGGEPLWGLPGGGVETGELFHEALAREVREETGLVIGQPCTTAFIEHIDTETHPSALAVALEVDGWHGQLRPSDPDILDLEFVPTAEALRRLAESRVRHEWEPPVGYLNGTVPAGTTWLYRSRRGIVDLLARWP